MKAWRALVISSLTKDGRKVVHSYHESKDYAQISLSTIFLARHLNDRVTQSKDPNDEPQYPPPISQAHVTPQRQPNRVHPHPIHVCNVLLRLFLILLLAQLTGVLQRGQASGLDLAGETSRDEGQHFVLDYSKPEGGTKVGARTEDGG